jgi:hypothetical protein
MGGKWVDGCCWLRSFLSSAGRLERLAGFARLSSEPEDRFLGWSRSPEQAEPWLTQAPGFANFRCQNTVITAISALIVLSTFSSIFSQNKQKNERLTATG